MGKNLQVSKRLFDPMYYSNFEAEVSSVKKAIDENFTNPMLLKVAWATYFFLCLCVLFIYPYVSVIGSKKVVFYISTNIL